MSLAQLPTRTLRHATAVDLIRVLEDQHRQKVDRVVPVSSLRIFNGQLEVAGMDDISVPPVEEDISEHGVTPGQPGYNVDVNGAYQLTHVFDGQLANLFKIPVAYMRRLREENLPLFDANANLWAPHGQRLDTGRFDSSKKVLLRLLWGSDPSNPDTVGVARALLSDRYGARDNLDTALAVLDGMRAAGLTADHIIGADLSDNRFYLYVAAPEVNALAPVLLDGYSPYHRKSAIDLPRVHTGFAVTNSETGGGALAITPRMIVEWCGNGMQITKEALRKVHLGTKLDEGNVVWSAHTRETANELTRSQVVDAVHSFLSPEFLNHQIDVLQRDCTTEIDNVTDTIENVGAKLQYTKTERNGILAHFVKGGQITSGGVLHAVTSYAQQIDSPDRSWDVEASAVEAMHIAARLQTA